MRGPPLLATGPTLLATGVDGLVGRNAAFEDVVTAIRAEIDRLAADEPAERLFFPPLINRADFEASGYFRNFGNLVGTVHCFCGDEEAHRAATRVHDAGGDWTASMEASDLVLTPSACYPVYPAIAARGPVPRAGLVVEVLGWCFRRETASGQASRLQCFRMLERVHIGTEESANAFLGAWSGRAAALATSFGLAAEIAVGNDPFFGRAGAIMVESQRASALKHELLVPIGDRPVACASLNLHLTKMSDAWGLAFDDGARAVTACVGFGLERLALAIIERAAAG